jgi:ERCC4-type nuclease
MTWKQIKDAKLERLLPISTQDGEDDDPTPTTGPTEGPVVVVDSREQRPWKIEAFRVVIKKLDFADYSLLGFERRFAVERKSLADLIQSLTHERTRFHKELEALSRCSFAAIFIEAERATVESGAFRGAVSPKAILSSLDAISIRLGVHVVWCGSHAEAGRRFEGMARLFIHGVEKDARTLGLIPKKKRATGRKAARTDPDPTQETA